MLTALTKFNRLFFVLLPEMIYIVLYFQDEKNAVQKEKIMRSKLFLKI